MRSSFTIVRHRFTRAAARLATWAAARTVARAVAPALLLLAVGSGVGADGVFLDVGRTHLPLRAVRGFSMDAEAADLDGDGDLDILLATEYAANVLLLNAGDGRFAEESVGRIPQVSRDSEDIATADFDNDGDIDIVIVSEDDQVNEYYLNRGNGFFDDASNRLPVTDTTNAVVAADLTGDGFPDLVLGNNGQNRFLRNDGSGGFVNETRHRMPALKDTTQDLELGDIDGDGDLDLLVANEDRNRVLLNDGEGRFSDETVTRLPLSEFAEESREGDFGDVDGDGDLDIVFANVNAFVEGANPQNRLLLNDGMGSFTDVTYERLPPSSERSFDADFFDIDEDGDLDIITANSAPGGNSPAPVSVYRNDGSGTFTAATGSFLPATARGNGFDIEAADFNGDGRLDLYLANRGGGPDKLFLR